VILLYDSDCGFCIWMMWLILRRDPRGAIRPLPIRSAAGGDLLAELDPPNRLASWHAIDAAGRRYSGGDAFVPVLDSVPRLRMLARALALLPRPLLRLAYRAVATHRARLGRLVPQEAKRAARRGLEDLVAARAQASGDAVSSAEAS
jgi:predicted DCC family thiol-disulfide oxidoreductase YuxK